MMDFTCNDLVKMIDHALLHPKMTDSEIKQGCEIAKTYQVAGVCVKPYSVKLAAAILRGTDVKVGVTIGFPHGANDPSIKAAESERACLDGAEELDMVVNVGKVLSGDWDFVRNDIEVVRDVAHAHHAILKVIFENCYLSDEHKIRLCELCSELRVDYVKTSTGFGDSGATIEDVKLMRRYSPPEVKIKAAGGIRNLDQFLAFRAAGADRIGVSATAKIIDECKQICKRS
jgi:deoxyribose-phosphate aldolase